MQDSYKGLSKITCGLEDSLQNPDLSGSIRITLQDALDKDKTNLKKTENLVELFEGLKRMSKTIKEIYSLNQSNQNAETAYTLEDSTID